MSKPIPRLFVFFALLFFSFSFTSPAFSQHAPAPSAVHMADFKTLTTGEAVTLSDSNRNFIYGVVSKFHTTCGWPYADSQADVTRFISSVEKGVAGSIFQGSRQGAMPGFEAYFTGQQVQQGADTVNAYLSQQGCKPSVFTQALEKTVLGKHQKGELRVWVKTCMDKGMKQSMCQCVGEVGETVVPGALDIPYSDQVFRSFLERNPLLAFTLPSLCDLR